jgi:hypothetical protein
MKQVQPPLIVQEANWDREGGIVTARASRGFSAGLMGDG